MGAGYLIARKYAISFTTCSIRKPENLKIAKLYTSSHDWKRVRETVIADNVLQQRTLKSTKRLYREISSRLRQLTADEFELLLSGSDEEQNQLLWLASCRRYDFIYDFAVEVIREYVLRLDYKLPLYEFDAFWASKAMIDENLDSVALSTKKKARQIVFKMLREVGLVDEQNNIQQLFYSLRLIETIEASSRQDLAIFPISEAYIESLRI